MRLKPGLGRNPSELERNFLNLAHHNHSPVCFYCLYILTVNKNFILRHYLIGIHLIKNLYGSINLDELYIFGSAKNILLVKIQSL